MRRRMRPFRPGFRGHRRGFRRPLRRAGAAFRPTRRRIRRRGRRLLLGPSLAVLLLGRGAIKLQRADLDEIERHAGRPADEMTEDDLFAAMEALDIERLELTAEEAILVEKSAAGRSISGPCPRCGAPAGHAAPAGKHTRRIECRYCGTLL